MSPDPALHDRIDEALWELAYQIHVGRPKRELIDVVQQIRWMRQGERAIQIAKQHIEQPEGA